MGVIIWAFLSDPGFLYIHFEGAGQAVSGKANPPQARGLSAELQRRFDWDPGLM